jgi:cytoskeleton protein RodZ
LFEIGESLAAARRAQRLELADVELLTCIRQRNLVALEAERFGLLPGHAYARAFLRTYASALGLDADRFVAEFDERYPETDEEPVLAFLPRRRRHPPVRAAAVLAALAAIGAFVAWSSTSQQGSLPKLAPPTTAAAAPVHRFRPAPVVTPPKPKPTNLVIHAARGNCWLLVRLGGASGRVLYEATLPAGHRITFGGAKLWIRFGAPANVDVRRGGRVVRGLAGAGDTPLNLVV